MEQLDMRKLEKALIYVERIVDGKNPVNNLPAEDDAVLNDPNVIRCMYFIKDILIAVKNQDGKIGMQNDAKSSNKTGGKEKQFFPVESLSAFEYIETKTISKLVEQINSGINVSVYKRITHNQITTWLKNNGYLIDLIDEKIGKKTTKVTGKGEQLGITQELVENAVSGYSYYRIEYTRPAQEFIIRKIPEMIKKTS